MKKGEYALCLLMLVLVMTVFVISETFPPALQEGDIGPAYFPRLLATMLLFFTLLQLYKTFKSSEQEVSYSGVHKMAACLLSYILYIFTSNIWGYFVVTPIFILVILNILGSKKWLLNVLYTVIFTAFVYLVFYKILMLPLPAG